MTDADQMDRSRTFLRQLREEANYDHRALSLRKCTCGEPLPCMVKAQIHDGTALLDVALDKLEQLREGVA